VSKKGTAFLYLAGVVWLIAIALGMGKLWRYSLTPGVAGTPPALWPTQSRIVRSQDAVSLVMVVHPHCPCSDASIEELGALMAEAHGPVEATVVFIKPPDFSVDWAKSSLWRSAGAIPRVSATLDDGREARLFGAATSGQTMVYGRDGRLLFSGGITAARGHFGDNAGASAIAALLARPAPHGRTKAPVYGCPLFALGAPAGRSTRPCQR
jgi:hypothetical protein